MLVQDRIDQELRRLSVLIEDTNDHVLTFALHRDAQEQRESAEMLKNLLTLPVTDIELKGDRLNPAQALLALPKSPRQVIFFSFRGSSLPKGESEFDRFAGYANLQREGFASVPHAVVFWLREAQLVRLIKGAPDLWAWRSGVFDCRGELLGETATYRELEEADAYERSHLEEQAALYQEIINAQAELKNPDRAYLARTRLRLAATLWKLGLYEDMLTEAREALRLARALETEALEGDALNSIAYAYQNLGRYDEAEPLFRETLAIGEKTVGKEHRIYATRLNNLARLLSDLGRYDEAEPLHREALTITEKTLGKEHPNHAAGLNNLAHLLSNLGRHDEAEPLFRQALTICVNRLGKDHPHTQLVTKNYELFLEQRNDRQLQP